MTKLYESDSLATAIESRTKQYKDLEDKLITLENTFKALVDNTEFKGKGADNIKSFYQAQIDLVKDWKKFIQAVTDFYSDVPKWAEDYNLAESTKVAIPFLEEGLETGSKNSKTMVETQHSDLEEIFKPIHDLISLTAFSTESFDTNMKKADTKRSETVTAVENLDTSYKETYTAQSSTIGVVQQGYMAIMNATAKSGSVQPMNFNVKTYQADPIHEVRKNVQESIEAYQKQQEEAQKIRDEIAAEKAKIEAEKARIEAEKNKPWYEKTWDGVKTFAGEFSGYYDSVRATTGVDPVTGRKLSNAERVAAGAMAAAGFIPVVGWAGRAVKGGSAIYKTAKGINTANHMLDAYKGTKAMDILNKTEKGIYGLYTANSAWEFGSGRDMFGNKLTEEQRQNALWNGLTMGLVGGGAHIIDKGGLSKLANKAPHSTAFVRDKVAKAQESLKQIGKQVGNKTHQTLSDLGTTAKESLKVVGREIGKVDLPVVVVRKVASSTGETLKVLGMESRKLSDIIPERQSGIIESRKVKDEKDAIYSQTDEDIGFKDSVEITGADVYGPHYEQAIGLYESKSEWFPNPDESTLVKGNELKAAREEYNSLANSGLLEKGHHVQGLAFGGENVSSNIKFTGESTIKSDKLSGLDLSFYHTQGYGKENAKILKIHQTEGGVFIFGNNPNHTEATVFQNKVLKWQRDNDLR
ncbi:ribonuclease YeeF family protein [Metabacillus sp. KIGAM252]|uniref:Ribonuclease YeeF family protein n=1 Tax=Metabacillus flavus TaxID=2823519 RepID=A0ABS5LB12_9BACI|nr:T7SS effector LXG polymorphic toxin [Metabacillus flavus]MBS2967915.1 ribonuclease YeeF family protein [Metabacillus flavus]